MTNATFNADAKLLYLIEPWGQDKLIVWTDIKKDQLTTINGVRTASQPVEHPPYWVLKVDPRWPLSYYKKRIRQKHESALKRIKDDKWHRFWTRKPYLFSIFPDDDPEG